MGRKHRNARKNRGARACAQKEPLKVQPPAPPPETVKFPELPFDVIPLVLHATVVGHNGRDPEATCRAAARWSTLNKTHRDACRDDGDAWRALIERVFPAETIPEQDTPNLQDLFDAPRAFFYALCDRAWRRRWEPIWYVLTKHFTKLPFDYPGYFEIAKLVASRKAHTPGWSEPSTHGLSEVPTDMPRYGEIVRWAVQRPIYEQRQQSPNHNWLYSALKLVPADRADYGELARLAIEAEDSSVMNWVPMDREDYGELARLAMKKAYTFAWIKTDHANYREIAKYAIEQHRGAIQGVPTTHPDYPTLLEFHQSRWKNWKDWKTGAARVRGRRGGARTG